MPPASSIALQGGGLSQVGGAGVLSRREGGTCVLGGCGGTGGLTRLALGLICSRFRFASGVAEPSCSCAPYCEAGQGEGNTVASKITQL